RPGVLGRVGGAQLRQGPALPERPGRPRGRPGPLPSGARGGGKVTAFGSERLLEGGAAALRTGGADDCEARVYGQAGGLPRFASSRIHQSAWREDLWVRVRVAVDGNRVGTATVHAADAHAVRRTARRGGAG